MLQTSVMTRGAPLPSPTPRHHRPVSTNYKYFCYQIDCPSVALFSMLPGAKHVILLHKVKRQSPRGYQCNSVRNSVRNSVANLVRNSVGNSMRNSMGNSVGNSVGNSARNSVRNSVGNRYPMRNSVRKSQHLLLFHYSMLYY